MKRDYGNPSACRFDFFVHFGCQWSKVARTQLLDSSGFNGFNFTNGRFARDQGDRRFVFIRIESRIARNRECGRYENESWDVISDWIHDLRVGGWTSRLSPRLGFRDLRNGIPSTCRRETRVTGIVSKSSLDGNERFPLNSLVLLAGG